MTLNERSSNRSSQRAIAPVARVPMMSYCMSVVVADPKGDPDIAGIPLQFDRLRTD